MNVTRDAFDWYGKTTMYIDDAANFLITSKPPKSTPPTNVETRRRCPNRTLGCSNKEGAKLAAEEISLHATTQCGSSCNNCQCILAVLPSPESPIMRLNCSALALP